MKQARGTERCVPDIKECWRVVKWSPAGEGSEWLATALIGRGGLLVFAAFALDKHPPACRGGAMQPAPSPRSPVPAPAWAMLRLQPACSVSSSRLT